MNLKLLVGIKSFIIKNGRFTKRPLIPPNTKLALKKLRLMADFPPSPAFLNILLPAASSLTRLELRTGFGGIWFPKRFNKHLGAIAHQLHHLTMPDPALASNGFDLLGFVTSCTSLKSLELHDYTIHATHKVLAVVPSALDLLEIDLGREWSQDNDPVAALLAILELPAAAELKRWRLTTGKDCVKMAQERASWEEGCRARGVEPRDGRRFFTDLC
ncbi:hypothetical protein BCR35DRAFT_99913 [Leucosporidium creatinivorum]|uniref:F-box domain-containing protein n=1 Tax=Leucosporidium creatinivorum TaxID=106004 RepID=A0A1Y2F4V3_9BASI|nr:hypothetical protein BCR35DRAFT_99913 [Leucosporidium creatinivorum]